MQPHQRMPVQAGPRSTLERTQPEFLFELLVRLLADPARLDGGGEAVQRCARPQVAEVALALIAAAPFADQPDLLARQVPPCCPGARRCAASGPRPARPQRRARLS